MTWVVDCFTMLPNAFHKPLRLREKLLLLLSRKPGTHDYAAGHDHWSVENALDKLCVSFPGFMNMIRGKDILDYGCGEGYQSAAMARYGARRVLGVDINAAYRERVRELLINDTSVFLVGAPAAER